MKSTSRAVKLCLAFSGQVLLTAAFAANPAGNNTHSFAENVKTKVQGVIVSRDDNSLKLMCDDNTIGTIDVTDKTKIRMKSGWSSRAVTLTELVPGLELVAEGKGDEKGGLVARKISFDRYSKQAARQIDSRLAPVNAKTAELDSRSGNLEDRAGNLENRADNAELNENLLARAQEQTNGHVAGVETKVGQVETIVGQVRDEADQNVKAVNQRVSDLDTYTVKGSATVYFGVNSVTLTADAKAALDELAQATQDERGYRIEIAGFADTTGSAARNQTLSDQRALAVVRYLEEQHNIPITRLLLPTGMGTSHPAADNKTVAGRKMNRRVEIRLLVNQGLMAAGNTSNQVTASIPQLPPAPALDPQ